MKFKDYIVEDITVAEIKKHPLLARWVIKKPERHSKEVVEYAKKVLTKARDYKFEK